MTKRGPHQSITPHHVYFILDRKTLDKVIYIYELFDDEDEQNRVVIRSCLYHITFCPCFLENCMFDELGFHFFPTKQYDLKLFEERVVGVEDHVPVGGKDEKLEVVWSTR